jgi:hypothetical protein
VETSVKKRVKRKSVPMSLLMTLAGGGASAVLSIQVSSARTETEVKNAVMRLDYRREEHLLLSSEVRAFTADMNKRLGRMEGILEEMQRRGR